MPEVLLANTEVLGEEPRCLLLQDLFVLVVDRVPKFGFAFVDQVEPRQVEVLCVPAKEGLPAAYVTVGGVDALDPVREGVHQDGVELAEVPILGG